MSKIAVLLIFAVNSVVDRNEAHTLLRKEDFCIKPHLQVIAPKPGYIFDNNGFDLSGFNLFQHIIPAGSLEVCSRKTIIHEENRVRKMIFLRILG
jgi:hypothetical protein